MDYREEYDNLSRWLSQHHPQIYADYKMGRPRLEYEGTTKLHFAYGKQRDLSRGPESGEEEWVPVLVLDEWHPVMKVGNPPEGHVSRVVFMGPYTDLPLISAVRTEKLLDAEPNTLKPGKD